MSRKRDFVRVWKRKKEEPGTEIQAAAFIKTGAPRPLGTKSFMSPKTSWIKGCAPMRTS